MSIQHDFSMVDSENKITLITEPGKYEAIWVRYLINNEQFFEPMIQSSTNDSWFCRLKIEQSRYQYRFLCKTDDTLIWYNRLGISEDEPLDMYDFKIAQDYQPPDWLQNSIFYQIFPDSYKRRQAQSLKSQKNPYGKDVYFPEPDSNDFVDQDPCFTFLGGNLSDIEDSLSYLKDLGVTSLYINPVFTSYSNHKYDAVDYDVDIDLGGPAALKQLIQTVHKNDMYIILDAVPNHCGSMHTWFRKALENELSPEHGFFYFEEGSYANWLGVESLPKFNYGSKELRNRMYNKEDSVLQRYIRDFKANGWRIDVANMLGTYKNEDHHDEVIHEINVKLKSISRDVFLLAEHYFDASKDLSSMNWDSSMNYKGFRFPLISWLSAQAFGQFGEPDKIKGTKKLVPRDTLIGFPDIWQ